MDEKELEELKKKLLPNFKGSGKVVMFIRGGAAQIEAASPNLKVVKE